ncbi:MAG: M56 family metallopeptidase [bacterium]
MSSFITYMLESAICITIFYLTYRLLFHRDTFFTVNRFFLIITLFLAMLIPAFSVSTGIESEVMYYGTIQTIIVTADNIERTVESGLSSWEVAAIIYLTGLLIFTIRFLVQMIQLIIIIRKCGINKILGYKIVFTEGKFAPFSFFNIIFLNESFMYNDDTAQILAHEKIHIQKKHTYDIILLEIFTIIQWFNPFIWFYRNSIRDVHEYQADEGVVSKGYDKINYQKLILKQITGAEGVNSPDLFQPANNFNYSTIKRRIIMLTKSRTKKMAILKFLLVLPMSALLVLAFSCSESGSGNKTISYTLEYEDGTETVKYDTPPQFPGGHKALSEFLRNNQKVPEKMVEAKTAGKVTVRFKVNTDGSLEKIRVAQTLKKGGKWSKDKLGYGCDEEALRLVKSMPKWKPAVYKGKPIKITQSLIFFFGTEEMQKNWNDYYNDEANWTAFKLTSGSKEGNLVDVLFAGGHINMVEYLSKNLKYPEEARKKGVEGTVIVAFKIGNDGKVSEAKVVQSIGYGCDEEAVRVVSKIPNWEIKNKVSDDFKCEMKIPIKFKLQDKGSSGEHINAVKVQFVPQKANEYIEIDQMPKMDVNTYIANFKYPEEARKKGITGTVYVRALVGTDGKVKETKIESSENDILSEAAVKAIESTVFEPAMDKGKKVQAWVTIPVKFQLGEKKDK